MNSYAVTENELQTVDTFYVQANRAFAGAAFFAGLCVSIAIEGFLFSESGITNHAWVAMGVLATVSFLLYWFGTSAMKGRRSLLETVKEESVDED